MCLGWHLCCSRLLLLLIPLAGSRQQAAADDEPQIICTHKRCFVSFFVFGPTGPVSCCLLAVCRLLAAAWASPFVATPSLCVGVGVCVRVCGANRTCISGLSLRPGSTTLLDFYLYLLLIVTVALLLVAAAASVVVIVDSTVVSTAVAEKWKQHVKQQILLTACTFCSQNN